MVEAGENDTMIADFLQTYFVVLPIIRDIAEQAVIVR